MRDFSTWTDTVRSGVVEAFSDAPLGEVYDDLFGVCRGMFLSELFPVSTSLTGYDASRGLDSAFFSMRFGKSFYDAPLRVRVYALDTIISLSEASIERDYTSERLIAEGILGGGDRELRLPLNAEWARDFMNSRAPKMGDPIGWPSVFHGIRVVAERETAAGGGRMLSFNIGNEGNGLQFYWTGDTVRSLKLRFFSYCRRYYRVMRDLTGSQLASVVASDRSAQNESQVVYVGEYGGGRAGIDFTRFRELWSDSMPLAINRAELRIPLAHANAPLGDTLVTRLEAFVKDGDVFRSVPEMGLTNEIYGGYYLRVRGYFSLNLTYTIQRLLRGNIPGNTVYLDPVYGNFGLGRVILSNGKSAEHPMELVITYTRL